MPFRSQAQRSYLYATHPDIARRWQAEYGQGKLPKRVAVKKTKKGRKRKKLKKSGY